MLDLRGDFLLEHGRIATEPGHSVRTVATHLWNWCAVPDTDYILGENENEEVKNYSYHLCNTYCDWKEHLFIQHRIRKQG